MPQLEARRPTPLTPAEARLLPSGIVATDGADGVVARGPAPEAPAALVARTVALARAVPDAAVVWVETGLMAPASSPAPTPAPRPAPAPGPRPDPGSPWQLLDAGDLDGAVALLAGTTLDADGREAARALLQATDPARVVAGVKVVEATGWRSSVTALRRLLSHGDTRVRLAAVQAVGALAGPGVVPALARLERADPSPEVRAAATAAITRLDGGDDVGEE